MDRRREFDHAKAGTKVTAGDGNRVDGFLPQLVGDLAELAWVKLTQVCRRLDTIEERRLAGSCHDNASHLVYVLSPTV
jgi:hypothetical protein